MWKLWGRTEDEFVRVEPGAGMVEEDGDLSWPRLSSFEEEEEDDDVEEYLAEDVDGLREARARLSLDDAKIRSRPLPVKQKEDELGLAVGMSNVLNALENGAGDMEGIVHLNVKHCPHMYAGTCGEAGREPFRLLPGENRRYSMEYRKENQDSYIAMAPFFRSCGQMLFGVFDGHGEEGRRISQFVRSHIAKSLRNYCSQSSEELLSEVSGEGGEISDYDTHRKRARAIIHAYVTAEDEISQSYRGFGHLYSGTTAVTAWIIGSDLYCGWVGDSRAVLGQQVTNAQGYVKKYRTIELTSDHKPARPDEKKRIRMEGGRIARWRKNTGPQRVWLPNDWVPGLAMTRSIGDTLLSPYGVCPLPEVSHTKLGMNDSFIVLASDGVWEFMTSKEVVEFVGKRRAEYADPNVVAEALVQESTRRWRRSEAIVDDTTAVIVYLNFDGISNVPVATRRGLFSFRGKKAKYNATLVNTEKRDPK